MVDGELTAEREALGNVTARRPFEGKGRGETEEMEDEVQ